MKHKKLIITLAVILFVIGGLFGAYFGYTANYSHTESNVIESCEEELEKENCSISLDDDCVAYIPEEIKAGFIFYPGGKVEYTAYSEIMTDLAEEGILCVVPHMTGNLAFMEMNAAGKIMENYPQVEKWYTGGHSLGGVAASSYVKNHAEDFDGLILLAAYSSADISSTDLPVLLIYGSEDGVLNIDAYENAKSNLPSGYEEDVIEGGCHGYFGSYGEQNGDGTAAISRESQQAQTVQLIENFIC